ncbi:MAG: TylF/MycF/NovP-related O-methyltransferase [Phormidium sp.]
MFVNLKNVIKSVAKRLGYEVVSIKHIDDFYSYLNHQNQDLIKELENLYRELIFKELPLDYGSNRLELMSQLLGTKVSEAIYLLNYLHKSLILEGDICEFGVAQGATSALIAYEIRDSDKNIWLFDSFEGLPKPTEKDILKDDIFGLGSIEAYQGTMSCKVDLVKDRLNKINFSNLRIKIIPGFIEETINKAELPDKVCFAYVDFDFYEPILIALNFLDRVLQINGFIVVDDYDFFSTGAKIAVDEFIAANSPKYNFFLPVKAAGNFCILEKIA